MVFKNIIKNDENNNRTEIELLEPILANEGRENESTRPVENFEIIISLGPDGRPSAL